MKVATGKVVSGKFQLFHRHLAVAAAIPGAVALGFAAEGVGVADARPQRALQGIRCGTALATAGNAVTAN